MRLVESHQLTAWAGSKQAEARFPHIVKSLINATVEPEKLRMPSGDAVWLPGLDGIVVNAGTTSQFVPVGTSAWELGTDAKIGSKADDDFEKRSVDKPSEDRPTGAEVTLDRKQTTFVFVTPRLWKAKEQWVTDQKAKGIWLDVKALDGADLQDWLEQSPSVNLAFAAELGFAPPAGLHTPDQAWEDWSTMSVPPASEELAVAGRESEEGVLAARLSAAPSTFTVRGVSPRDAWGFALATLRRGRTTQAGQSLLDRAIVADNEGIAGALRNLKNLIIILKETHGPVSRTLSAHGSHVILPEGGNAQTIRDVVELPLPTHRQFSEALVRMGLPESEAERLTRASGRSVALFQRQAAHAKRERPNWADGPGVSILLAALLAGGWSRNCEADRAILCLLADQGDYESLEIELNKFQRVDEAPLRNVGELWMVIAPADTLELVARQMTKAQLDRFAAAFRQVFGEVDPRADIPLDDWLYEDLKGEKGNSAWLRAGMAETLLLLAERGAESGCGTPDGMRAYVDGVAKGLPRLGDDWRTLASLRDQYPRLMEAAPDPFVDGLEQLIRNKPEDLRKLFSESTGFGPSPMHTGMLWGLEALAWSPNHLNRVSLILARLASIDPGGRWSNRPLNSLHEIFLWWHPGTNASTAARLAALDQILQTEPAIGWELLSGILPQGVGSSSHPTARPRWHDCGELPHESRTRRGQMEYLSAIIDRALARAGHHANRWNAILDAWTAFGPAQRARALSLLNELAESLPDAEARTQLWDLLREFTSKHRAFKDASWALDDEAVGALEQVLAAFEPADLFARFRWLFDEWMPDLPAATASHEAREAQVQSLRRAAAEEIFRSTGLGGLLSFALLCKFSRLVPPAARDHLLTFDEAVAFLSHAIAAGGQAMPIVASISEEALKIHGDIWQQMVIEGVKTGKWSSEISAALMLAWPSNRATWELVDALPKDTRMAYWRRQLPFISDGSTDEQVYKTERLIEAGCAANALTHASAVADDFPGALLLRLFDAALAEASRAAADPNGPRAVLQSYDVRQYLGQLRDRTDISQRDIAQREYQALPLLGPLNAHGLVLHDLMAEDPELFVSVICDVFLPQSRDKSQPTEVDAEARARAQASYSLLQSIDRVPGQTGNDVDEQVLRHWLSGVREKARVADRVEITEQQLGAMLAHSPDDPVDSAWPHRAVRSVLEDMSSEELENGLLTERHNMRGVYTKAIYEGGVQERQLAEEYRNWALAAGTQWPKTNGVLTRIAESWDRLAEHEDTRAEQRRLGDS